MEWGGWLQRQAGGGDGGGASLFEIVAVVVVAAEGTPRRSDVNRQTGRRAGRGGAGGPCLSLNVGGAFLGCENLAEAKTEPHRMCLLACAVSARRGEGLGLFRVRVRVIGGGAFPVSRPPPACALGGIPSLADFFFLLCAAAADDFNKQPSTNTTSPSTAPIRR